MKERGTGHAATGDEATGCRSRPAIRRHGTSGDIAPHGNFGRRIRIVDEAATVDREATGFMPELVHDRRLPTSCLWISMISTTERLAIFKACILVFL